MHYQKEWNCSRQSSRASLHQENQRQDFFKKIKTGYKLELISLETMALFGSKEKDIGQDKDGEDMPKLESVEVVLVHCNLVNNSY